MASIGPTGRPAALFEAAGIRWHVQQTGQGPPLLLIHGTGAATHSWRGLMPILAQHFCRHRAGSAGPRLHAIAAVAPALAAGHGVGFGPAIARAQGEARHRCRPFGGCGDPGANVPRQSIAPRPAGQSQRRVHAVRRRRQSSALAAGQIAGDESAGAARVRLAGLACRGRRTTDRRTPARPSMRRGIALYRKLVRSPAHVAAALRMMANWRLEPLLHDLPRLTTRLVLVAAAKATGRSRPMSRSRFAKFIRRRSSSACRPRPSRARRTTAIDRGSHHEIRVAAKQLPAQAAPICKYNCTLDRLGNCQ